MGRRRRRKVLRRPERKIPTIFTCPSCGEESVKVEINKNEGYAIVGCGACGGRGRGRGSINQKGESVIV
ncbi:MAG: hypothetical protein ACTSRF_06010 [Candidatus Freyarchaeota archaeon]